MKNNNRPFFYEKKKTPLKKILLIVIVIIFFTIFTGLQIPSIRQIISQPLFAGWSFLRSSVKTFFSMTRKYHEAEIEIKKYDPIELPDQQVLFAESLENLSALSQEDPLADLRQTPTPSEYSRVAEWKYLDPNLNYAISSSGKTAADNVNIRLIPPVFEHSDLFNDGPAILSACCRYWGIVENQYQIANLIHPDPMDPHVSFEDIEKYINQTYRNFKIMSRLNGDKNILVNLLEKGIPIIIFIQEESPYHYWLNDDRLEGRYILILGYDSQRETFYYQDTLHGNTLEISQSELLASWYPFQRKYIVLYPEDKDDDVRDALSENYYEELNLDQALTKFRTDSELLPENVYAQYNYADMLHLDGDNEGAWESFQRSIDLSLPQRFFVYQQDILQTALELGYADDLEILTKQLLDYNSHDEVLTVYQGWAEIIRKEYKQASDYFEKAKKINPDSDIVLYALKYRDTMINY